MPEIADSLKEVGIEDAFPIQEMTLSVALMGTDLIGQARTGTGKTIAAQSVERIGRVRRNRERGCRRWAGRRHA